MLPGRDYTLQSSIKKPPPVFKKGGSGRGEVPPQYRGVCCGGTRKPGDGNASTCLNTGLKYFVCRKCFRPLALTSEQKERIAKKREVALEKVNDQIGLQALLDHEKAEKVIMSMVNATVSHELRNPINSIHC